ncbi:AraC family transcriptional regulator [Chitinophaga sp. S165]|uniref:helix-turn-helix domain-containing protein n=1 Tax=Chitinophaga sp. S165 TaxID=2135462 RepID=UPI000D70F3C5|nr:helix-turn-helix transcriptional regulator [Chitinophaga sp. S165]PWV56868.1 AraC family transcriptional regulator [Chitinophaga sp. S165]
MNISQQILFIFSVMGALNGIMLSLYLFILKKAKPVATLFLGLLLMAVSIRVVKTTFAHFNPQLPKIYLQIGLSACFLIGPSLYYYFKAILIKAERIPASWRRDWGILLGILLVGGTIAPYQTYPWFWNNVVVYIIYAQWLFYVIASGFLLKDVLKAGLTDFSGLSPNERSCMILYLGNAVIHLAYVMALLRLIPGWCLSGAVCFTLVLYVTIFFYSYGRGYDPTSTAIRQERKKIAEEDAQTWVARLEKVIEDKALYKDPNLKLNDLAKTINISGHQLSQLLNDNLGKSYSTYINEYRINEACKLIATNSHLTFEAIAYEVGYNSKSTFYTAFKKIKDTTPALYKDGLQNSAQTLY